ncbi:unnamed protein product, partial [Thelazia callipaeda]|uniref:Uncharacterized protein n=1 Tax=Thelazia callipaeda TaxID=103827 RepID=A0A0N5CRU2_THECL
MYSISVFKRNNGYGDEPAVNVAVSAPPPPLSIPLEQAPQQAAQSYAAPAAVESSGYRKKRNNAYGDEAVPPSPAATLAMPAP